jgi:Leucine-rich repeat (LRR) protein
MVLKTTHLLFLLFFAKIAFSQTILDLNFAKAVKNQCPDCLNDRNQLQDAARKVKQLDLNFKGINDLTGIEGFTDLVTLDCSNNKLTQLASLSNPNLQHIRCANNRLTSLSFLPESLVSLDCSGNKIKFVYDLPEDLLVFVANGNPIAWLPKLPIHLQRLSCSGGKLTQAPSFPDELTEINLNHNQLKKLGKLPSQLSKLLLNNNQLLGLPRLPYMLKTCVVANNRLKKMPTLPDYLQILDVSNNQLDSLPSLPPRLAFLFFADNKIVSNFILPASLIELDCRRNGLEILPKLPRRLSTLWMKGNRLDCLGNIPEKLTRIDDDSIAPCLRPHYGLVEKALGTNAKTTFFKNTLVTTSESQLVPYRKGSSWGFANVRGELMIPPQYDGATLFQKDSNFSYSFSVVSLGSQKGVIDIEGEYIVPPDFQQVYPLTSGGFIVQRTAQFDWQFINEDAIVEEKIPVSVSNDPIFKRYATEKVVELADVVTAKSIGAVTFNESLSPKFIHEDTLVGYVIYRIKASNNKENELEQTTIDSVPPQYLALKYLSPVSFDTLLAQGKNGKWGIINTKNDTLVPFVHDDIKNQILTLQPKDSVKLQYLTAKKDGKWGIRAFKDTSVLLKYDFDDLEVVKLHPLSKIVKDSNDLFIKIKRDTSWGLMSGKRWQLIIPTEFKDIRLDKETQNGFKLIRGEQMGYYIIAADKTIAPRYKEVKYFKYGFAEVVTKQDTEGFVNENGDEYFLE